MKLIIEIKDNKAEFVMELLNSLSFVKAKPISDEKAELMEEIKEAVENLNLVKKGKLKARSAKELLNEL
jgi:polyhydroxyalkanoate synthesis regulator phasin